jgi:hypothetical protein
MSDKIAQEVWEYSRTKGTTKLVLLVLADNANTETREAWPSRGYLAQRCNCSERHVTNQLLILEEMEEIEVHEHPNWATTYIIRDYFHHTIGGDVVPRWDLPEQPGGNVKKRVAAIQARRPQPTVFEMPDYLRKRRGGRK